VWLKLRPLAYKVHPYRWATIGKELKHIEDAKMEDVKAFFHKYYTPQNAIMVVAGDVNLEEVKVLADKWFGNIPAGNSFVRDIPQEPKQAEARKEWVEADVPVDALYIAFHGPDRLSADYYATDLITDLLSRGASSRLYRALVKENQLFSDINAYMMGSIDTNLIVVEGKPLPHISLEEAEKYIWKELENIKTHAVEEVELQKVKNKIQSTMLFAELSILDKAMNLAFFEMLNKAEDYNHETSKYDAVTSADITRLANQIFREENSNTLYYQSKQKENVE